MKKRAALLFSVILAVCLAAGCGNKEKSLRELKVEEYVTVGDYKSITASMVLPEVSQKQVEQGVDYVWQGLLTEETGTKDRAVEQGDTVFISFAGYRDGVAFERGTGDSFLRIGSGSFIPGFEDGLVGVMPGETVNIDLTFPENYDDVTMAGAEVVFEVTVHYIGAEMNDENLSNFSAGEFSSVEELRTSLETQMKAYNAYMYKSQLENEVLSKMVEMSTYQEIPEWLTEKYSAAMMETLDNTAASRGVSAEDYCTSQYGMSASDYVSTYATEAVKQGLTFQAIANAENLNVDDEELNQSLEDYIAGSTYTSVEEFVGDKDIEEYREYFMFEKVLAYLCDVAAQNAGK